jgi:hypothetical protein
MPCCEGYTCCSECNKCYYSCPNCICCDSDDDCSGCAGGKTHCNLTTHECVVPESTTTTTTTTLPPGANADCNDYCTDKGYPGGCCWCEATGPYSDETGYCEGSCLYPDTYGFADWQGDVGNCSGYSADLKDLGCLCYHNCNSDRPSKTITIGPCTITIKPRGWDDTDGSIDGYKGFDKGSNYVKVEMDDGEGWGEGGACTNDLEFKVSWSTSGDQISVTTKILSKYGGNDLAAGFSISISGSGCKITEIGRTACSGTCPDNSPALDCGTSKTYKAIKGGAGSYATYSFNIEYCGDNECTCGETLDSCSDDCEECPSAVSGGYCGNYSEYPNWRFYNPSESGYCFSCPSGTCCYQDTEACSGDTPYCLNGECVQCRNDEDCKALGITCDDEGYPHRYAECDDEGPSPTYTCYCGPCEENSDCEPGYCCTAHSPGGPGETPGECVNKGTVKDEYLCT